MDYDETAVSLKIPTALVDKWDTIAKSQGT